MKYLILLLLFILCFGCAMEHGTTLKIGDVVTLYGSEVIVDSIVVRNNKLLYIGRSRPIGSSEIGTFIGDCVVVDSILATKLILI